MKRKREMEKRGEKGGKEKIFKKSRKTIKSPEREIEKILKASLEEVKRMREGAKARK